MIRIHISDSCTWRAAGVWLGRRSLVWNRQQARRAAGQASKHNPFPEPVFIYVEIMGKVNNCSSPAPSHATVITRMPFVSSSSSSSFSSFSSSYFPLSYTIFLSLFSPCLSYTTHHSHRHHNVMHIFTCTLFYPLFKYLHVSIISSQILRW